MQKNATQFILCRIFLGLAKQQLGMILINKICYKRSYLFSCQKLEKVGVFVFLTKNGRRSYAVIDQQEHEKREQFKFIDEPIKGKMQERKGNDLCPQM